MKRELKGLDCGRALGPWSGVAEHFPMKRELKAKGEGPTPKQREW